jgi:anaerobic magnesium-protoporphyrin IX monomethyl ester cyclase
VESASPAVLKAIRKGTNPEDIALVLREAHQAKIKNTVFIMFGFPGETEEDFIQTIDFLKKNSEYIDLVSTSIFGLQKGSYVYEHPEEFGIAKITGEGRTLLDETLIL